MTDDIDTVRTYATHSADQAIAALTDPDVYEMCEELLEVAARLTGVLLERGMDAPTAVSNVAGMVVCNLMTGLMSGEAE